MRSLAASFLLLLTIGSALLPGANIPRPAPEFGFEVPGGKQVLLSQYRGKTVMLAFFLTTCPHCQNTSVVVEKLYKELGPKGFQPLAVCIDDMAKLNAPDFIKKYGVTFPLGYSRRDPAYAFLEHPVMQQLYMPAIVMIDAKGTILSQHPGGDPVFGTNPAQQEENFRKLILDAMKPKAAAPATSTNKKPTVSKKTT
jgi:peroxiredoxin